MLYRRLASKPSVRRIGCPELVPWVKYQTEVAKILIREITGAAVFCDWYPYECRLVRAGAPVSVY